MTPATPITAANQESQPATTGPVRLLTIEEAAESMHMAVSSLRYMVHLGTAPRSARLGKRRMFRERDIQDWINARFEQDSSND